MSKRFLIHITQDNEEDDELLCVEIMLLKQLLEKAQKLK